MICLIFYGEDFIWQFHVIEHLMRAKNPADHTMQKNRETLLSALIARNRV